MFKIFLCFRLILEKEKPHKAEVPVPGHSERHEQCPRKMLAILSEILSDFDLKDLAGIGVFVFSLF
jgi:hypothetical protein